MESILQFDEVDFGYDPQSLVLQDVNFAIESGEFLGVVGPNGGGKTTLLKLIMGIIEPTAGTVKIFGDQPKLARHAIGYVPQFSTFKKDFPISVMNVVLTGRLGSSKRFFGYTKKDKKIAAEYLEKLGISHLHKKPIGALSGGQLQRVMIARALVSKPKLLLLDEPTANIDMHAEQSVFDLLSFLNHDVTIIVVSHDIGFVSRYINKVICVNKSVFCHEAKELTPELIEKLYGFKLKVINHN
jgi:zinc transport system ATP-binding protein